MIITGGVEANEDIPAVGMTVGCRVSTLGRGGTPWLSTVGAEVSGVLEVLLDRF